MRPTEPASGWSVAQQNHAIDAAELALTLVAHFRAHPHVCNVMTHISSGNWAKVERALAAILDQDRSDAKLSKLEENIVELFCAERGVTGRILKPFFAQLLVAYLSADAARAVTAHVGALFTWVSEPEAVPAPPEPVVVPAPQWILDAQRGQSESLTFCASATTRLPKPATLKHEVSTA